MTRRRGFPRPPVGWAWTQWQLVRVEEDEHGLVVDALEVPEDGPDQAALPVTLRLAMASPAGRLRASMAGSQLARWLERQDGMCDVLHQRSEPFDYLALFQGAESVVLTADEDEA
jgi:hypothetical protein